ncbi:LOW QUALITY PROTEIN: nascent polypeptide-associated complex subunit alpha, muscle-specific form [Leguminivora glycinivorella]|uniref:LOW QUALITY PROTEIN: nascent polypeptide-associated complex subunit alpha, muscle-specific form n=1 Tax=Leguminivora glycinivorella TaxID=1035111 RepID=UPI00200E89B4|nr:LOW QUALITY PROTEIN: nascent polypeptide-associated complex subunit alpha, muscle-specific form [Leguminivora glycinivorella]
MESSEDDAGAATNASRRASAREKGLGLNEEVDATANASREASGAQTPCESGTMSEDNFDGDSVPSPSTHDNNASTEAILDMIDEICDGPGAPKRVPLSAECDEPATSPPTPAAPPAPSEPPPQEAPASEHLPQPSIPQLEEGASTSQNIEDPQIESVVAPGSGVKCESAPEILPETPVDNNISESSVSVDTNTSNIEPQASSSVPEISVPAETIAPEAQNLNVEAASTCSAVNIPSSSVETVPSVCEISECESNDRTVKHVTSSDNRDNVAVESVESTSSDVSVSEGTQEPATRSPLRRRLIRPTPYDRRPDTTVSSTVDSQVSDNNVGQTSCESVAKDVSSSSDIIPPVHGNVKDVESSNVSEISVCKAETSSTPAKKIKLVRQKITPSTSQSEKSQSQPVTPESEAPSTSSPTIPSTVTASCSSDCISTTESIDEVDKVEPSQGCQSESTVETINKLTNKTPVVSKENEQPSHSSEELRPQVNEDTDKSISQNEDVHMKVPPIKLNLSVSNVPEPIINDTNKQIDKHPCPEPAQDSPETSKQIPKLTIKLGGKQPEEIKSPIPKLTIKPIKPPAEDEVKTEIAKSGEPIPNITKINIKPILRPPEKINDIHRKSSSSEISESECSENDETSTSDQASTSDQGPSDTIPKVTIKLGKPGTDGEGKFYTDQPVPKLTIKGLQQPDQEASDSKLKLVVSPSEEKVDKIPKLTIKTVAKSDSQLSPKLTIKPVKSVENPGKDSIADHSDVKISKTKTTDCADTSGEIKETTHIPKITIKPVLKTDIDPSRRSQYQNDSLEQIPVVTKLNIKPILKPTDGEASEEIKDEVPVVSKLNIKPILKPKDSEFDSSIEDIPKVTKLNIKPLKHPEEKSSEQKDCDEWNADSDENSIPVVTKLNIKPIVKPLEDENMKDTENQSSETGNSSDDNTDIPVVTKLNIKPILKPAPDEDIAKPNTSTEGIIPVVTKLNIKPIIKPEENSNLSSPKKETTITKLNIKPVVKPDENEQSKSRDIEDANVKNPPLVMKINMKAVTDASSDESLKPDMKINHIDDKIEHVFNNINDTIPVVSKINIKPLVKPLEDEHVKNDLSNCHFEDSSITQPTENCQEVPKTEKFNSLHKKETIPTTAREHKTKENCLPNESSTLNREPPQSNDLDGNSSVAVSSKKEHVNTNVATGHNEPTTNTPSVKQTTLSNCTLLKKLLEHKKKDVDTRVKEPEECDPTVPEETKLTPEGSTSIVNCDQTEKVNSKPTHDKKRSNAPIHDSQNETPSITTNAKSLNRGKAENESITKPLEINISEKITTQSSGQDSPRIILKINKTDHGPSAKIITEDIKKPETVQDSSSPENTQEMVNDKQRKGIVNSKRKGLAETSPTVALGKRLRSSKVVQESEMSPPMKRNAGKRPPSVETSPQQKKEPELSVLETKRLKLGQLLSNKALTVSPVNSKPQNATCDAKTGLDCKQPTKTVNHSLLNNENCSKNGNSKLHNILSNLQAKQIQVMPLNSLNCVEKTQSIEIDSSTSTGSSDVTEVIAIESSHPVQVQEMIINENSESHDFNMANDELSQDPLEVDHLKTNEVSSAVSVPFTPQPKKRGRPRKLPVSEGAKPVVILPTPALEERPQRSLRLTRDRPAILVKPRGRGRGRGAKRTPASSPKEPEPIVETANNFFIKEEKTPEEIDPTSSRVKLPRMTEALDKMPSVCNTPLSSRKSRDSCGGTDMKIFPETQELKVVLETTLPKLEESFMKSPETPGGGTRGGRGRGSRGGAGAAARTPRGRGRGRGGGRGAMYMKETMGIYGRVCGPATTTVQLFEEETCMMDDNATPAKPSHLLDEDSQSSVKSSTNESSSKMRKSKFADLFDSNKVWTAADVKEYMWPPPENPSAEHQVMMVQEQVAMFLGVKSFKRRYPELKRRTVGGEERDYILRKGIVTEALCDLGITAVDASEVLDIMLSDYPHKYEEYRSHQRERQIAVAQEPEKPEVRVDRVEMKISDKSSDKPEPPKVDPEKTRQDMAAAAIASASEWNTRLNSLRRGACADLQSMTVQRRRTPIKNPATHVQPPAGFYPHALLPGQYQHTYRYYTPEQLRYFPLNTVVAAPPAPPSPCESSSESEPDWGSNSDSSDDNSRHQPPKRKKLMKVKRSSSMVEPKEEPRDEELCRACHLREEGNRKYTHERFLVCANCNCRLHPHCVELSADTIRKVREYAWQCPECKTCCACTQPADDDKMLFCDLCDRGFHIYCVGLDRVPTGRWHCVECAICKSCGARDPHGLTPGAAQGSAPAPGASTAQGSVSAPGAEWHHHTKRGPGGHKLYSHSLCTPCARAYRIGRYCPLCDRSFIGPKGTMQLVICKLCDRQLHQDCVRQTVAALNVLDYTCGECRRAGISSRSAAARLAPRTIATLFMAKRRFNKYAHRQYLASRAREAGADADADAEPDAAPDLSSDPDDPQPFED